MLTFIDAYTLWRALPFPRGGPGPDMPEIRGDLAEADEYVTTVIRFVEHGIFRPAAPDVLGLIDDVMERLTRLLDDEDERVRGVAREHHAYAALLRIVYAEFLRQGASPTRGEVACAS